MNATGCSYAPGIGSGGISANSYQVATEIIISGGKVNARGGCYKDSEGSAAVGIGIGELREGLNYGNGDAKTILTWTNDTMETMSVTSTGYNGRGTTDKTFVDSDGTTYSREIADKTILADKTLRPYETVWALRSQVTPSASTAT